MATLRLKKGDMIKVISGSFKGKTGKIVAVVPKKNAVKVEGLNVVTRHSKPSITNPSGGTTELHKAFDISKVALLHPTKKDTTSRVAYSINKDGTKQRVYRQANNKEIK